MKNIIYAICFCLAGFLMWSSIAFSIINKKYDMDMLFSNWKKIISVFICVVLFSIFMTMVSYIVVSIW